MKQLSTLLVAIGMACLFPVTGLAQKNIDPDSIAHKMKWFEDAKLGIFIHYGMYAVDGVTESWSFHNREVPYDTYMAQMKGFTASQYNPEEWADLIAESGAKYTVITTKHHDGLALWPTQENHYDVVRHTPAKRDLLTPFFEAIRKRGIKAGAYYSLLDWSRDDYTGLYRDSGRYKIEEKPQLWKSFTQFNRNQIREVLTRFNPDLWWFDGDWEHPAEAWQAKSIREEILQKHPGAIINGRLAGYGDYETPEQNFPVTRPNYRWWELCMTINSSWGFQHKDSAWKTPYEVISIFADAISNGGNLLLDIGPREDGTIPDEAVTVLKELGKWNRKHGEAIFGTDAGLPQGHFFGPSTIAPDSTRFFLFLAQGQTGQISIKGLMNEVESVRVIGCDQPLDAKVVGKISWSPVPGLVYIDVPESCADQYMTVVEVKLKDKLKLYSGKGGLEL